ncbi:hypothetical protein NL108_015445, partial [Boleophthalmus pectinirostris]
DAVVSCALQETCVLPCSFNRWSDPVIHWTKDHDGEVFPVHIYYHGQFQPQHQHQNFKGRTSLFEEELSKGNASLLLSGVKVQDEGRYKCFISAEINRIECDAVVSCALQETCVLPCSFNRWSDPVIHWTKDPDGEDSPVHIYYHGQNQPQHQYQNFKGRTSLFEEELSKGNASLLLSGVKFQDEGRYKCFISANINRIECGVSVNVYAPVSWVSLQQQEQQLLCRAEGVYPKPSVLWSPDPVEKPDSSIESSESGVWSVRSSVSLPHRPPYQYSCNVSNSRGSWKSATYRRIHISDNVVIPCAESKAPVKSIIWRFNHNQIILSWFGPKPIYSESWRQFVDEVTESNSLVLKNLTKEQLGLYTCELSSEQEHFISHTEVSEEKIEVEGKCLLVLSIKGLNA